MEFKLGEKVVYPNHGVGVIEQISYGYLNGRSERYYMLKIVSSGLKVMVPQSNILNVGLRPIIRTTQAGAVLSFLEKGRLRPLLESVPVQVVTNDKAGLLGAARCAATRSGNGRNGAS